MGGAVAQILETKIGLAAVIIATAGPLAAEVSMLAVGGLVGGVVAVAVDQRPQPSIWRSLAAVATGMAVALVLGGAISHVVPRLEWLQGYGLSPELLWAPVGFALAAFWRPTAVAAVRVITGWRRPGPGRGGNP